MGVSRDSMTVFWNEPESDGGAVVTNYLLEKRSRSKRKWTKATTDDIGGTQYRVRGLHEGKEYMFRVAAVNAAGQSEFSNPSEPTLAATPVTPPGPPFPAIKDTTGSSVTLTWKAPDADGGAKIKGYIVEKQKEGDEKWQKATTHELRTTEFTVPNLEEGTFYKFRVKAVNSAGLGEPGYLTESVLVEEKLEVADIILQGTIKDQLTVKAGSVVQISVLIKGRPEPTISWLKDCGPVPEQAKYSKDENMHNLMIRNSQRQHSGKYAIVAVNKAGEKRYDIDVLVQDVPGPCGGPIEPKNVTRDTIGLSWTPPDDNGGCSITNYVLEKRESSRRSWTPISMTVTRTSAVVQGLVENESYMFRVSAENILGVGPSIETTVPLVARDPVSEPGRPEDVRVTDVTRNTVSLEWKKPASDGGLEVSEYLVEKRLVGQEKYLPASEKMIRDTKVILDGFNKGDNYEFRVTAKNDRGYGPSSFPTKPVVCRHTVEPPTLTLEVKKAFVNRVGEPYRIFAKISGRPAPTVVWEQDGAPVLTDTRRKIKTDSATSSLEVQKGIRSDSGAYKIIVKNEGGQREAKLKISIVDKPTPPRELYANDVTSEHVVLTWNPPQDDGGSEITNYVVEKRDITRMMWSTVNSTILKTELRISKLIEGAEYLFRVMAENAQGCSDPALTDSIVIKDKYRVPDAPDALTVKDIQKDSVSLSWSIPYDGGKAIFNYVVEKREVKSERWARVTKNLINEPRFTVTDLFEGNEYEFRVAAENSIGVGSRCLPTKQVKMENPVTSPSPPINPQVKEISKNTVMISWKKPRHDGGAPIQGYIVETQKAGSEAWKIWCTQETQKDTKYTIPDLTESYEYRIRVTAVNKAGLSEPGHVKGSVIVKEKQVAPDIEPQASMTREQILKSRTRMSLSAFVRGNPFPTITWNKNDQPLPTNQDRLEYSCKHGIAQLCIEESNRGDSGRYSLVAENDAGKKTASIMVNVLDIPSEPLHLRVSEIRSDSCYLKWKAPADNGGAVVASYKIERFNVDSKVWKPVAMAAKKTSILVKFLTEGTRYVFRVSAENQFGCGPSASTEEIIARDPIHPPGPPKNLEISDVDKTSISLTWYKPDRNGGSAVTGFRVDFAEIGLEKDVDARLKSGLEMSSVEKEWIEFKTVTDTHCCVPNLKEGTLYKFRVRACNEAGEGRPDQTMPVAPRQKFVLPSIEIDPKTLEGLTIRANSTLRIPAKIHGVPIPSSLWSKADGNEVVEDERVAISKSANSTILTIKNAQREDTQEYTLTVKNDAGFKSAGVYVTILYRPSPPIGPINILEMTPEYAIIAWMPPKDDGGSPVTNYIVEKKDITKETWGVVSSKSTRTKCKIPRLIAGKEYNFRVQAENKYGISDTLESKPEVAKHMFDVPEPPTDLWVNDITDSNCSLHWKSPSSDGGNPIIGFIVERLDKESGKWSRITSEPLLGFSMRVKGLFEGREYTFRVIAENRAGLSKPSEQSTFFKAQRPTVPPGPPVSPKVTDYNRSSATLAWTRPLKDGGSQITGYFVECICMEPKQRESISHDWVRVNKEPISNHELIVPGLRENCGYMFRVLAVNKAGEGESKETVGVTLIKDIVEKPQLTLDGSMLGKVTFRVEQTIKLCARVFGKPSPEVSWKKDGQELNFDERYKVERTEIGTALTAPEAKRKDSGAYIVSAKNPAGEAMAKINVLILSKPSSCQNLKISYITKSSCVLTWDQPEDDGGTEIFNYILEMKEPTLPGFSSLGWTICYSEGTRKMTKVPLTENHEYYFRVTAENKCGLSLPLELKTPILACDPVQVSEPPKDLKVVTTGKDFVDLEWTKPDWDCGSPITGYQIVVMKRGTKDWKEIDVDKLDCKYRVAGLEEDVQYRFGVMARNKAGLSQVTVILDYVTVREHLMEPKIEIITKLIKGEVLVRANSDIVIKAKIFGLPAPEVAWKLNEQDLYKLSRCSIKVSDEETSITIANAKREDCGQYIATATNKVGSSDAKVKVNVLDKPSSCIGPIKIVSLNKDRCTIAWEAPSDNGGCEITNYMVEKCETSRMVWSVVTSSVSACTYPVPRLLEGNEYIFRVKAENKIGLGPAIESNPITAKSPYTTPSAPLLPEVSQITKGSALLTWKVPEKNGGRDINGYFVEKREKKGVKWSPCNTKPTHETRLNVISLSTGIDYQFRVLAENEIGVGEPSQPTKLVTIKEPTEKPGKPNNPKVIDTTKTSVTLSWGSPLSDGGTPLLGYVVESSVEGLDDWCNSNVGISSTHSTVFVVTGLRAEQTYIFRIAAINAMGKGEYEYVIGAVQPKEILEEPEIELDSAIGKTLEIKAGKNLLLQAIVKGRPKPVIKWSKQDTVLSRQADIDVTGQKTSLTIPNCTRSNTGKYLLTASNPKGSKSTSFHVKVLDTPGPVSNLIVKDITASSVQVSWTPPEIDGCAEIINYVVEMKEADKKSWSVATLECSKTAFKVTKLIEGKEYYFCVKAENKLGVGEPYETNRPVKIRMPISEPGPVTKLKVADVTKSTVSLTWKKPDFSGGSRIVGYVVEFLGEGSTTWTEFRTVSDPSVTVINLSSKKYQFRVKPKNEKLEGPASETDIIDVRDPAEPPKVSIPKEIKVHSGEVVLIKTAISGKPFPTTYWKRKDVELSEGGRIFIQKSQESSILKLMKSKREDSDDYTFIAKNAHGMVQTNCKVEVLDRPSKPIGPIEFKDINIDTVTLMWNAPEDNGGCPITNYIVEQSEAGKIGFQIVSSTVTRTTLRVSKLAKECEYIFRIKAENKCGVSDGLISTVVKTVYPFKPPGPPTNLRVLTVDKSSATLSWDVPEADGGNPVRGYNAERKEINSLMWTRINKSLIKRKEALDGNLLEGIEYQFRVQACNAAGIGEFCKPTETVLARDPCDPPGKPEVIDITNNSVELSWTSPRSEGGSKVVGYFVEMKKLPHEQWLKAVYTKTPKTSVVVNNLEEGERYIFRATTKTVATKSKPSEQSLPVVIRQALVAPEVSLDVACQNGIEVRAGQDIVIEAQISGKPKPSAIWQRNNNQMKSTSDGAIIVETALKYTKVIIRSCKRTDSGSYVLKLENTSGTATATINVRVLDVPSAPQGPAKFSDVLADRLKLTWSPPMHDGGATINSYIIERRETSRPTWAMLSGSVQICELHVTKLIKNHEYEFRISAENKFGIGPPLMSNSVVAKSPFSVPESPEPPTVTNPTNSSMTVSWKSPVDGGKPITGFYLEKRETKSIQWLKVNRQPVSDRSIKVTNLSEGVEYEFRVFAQNIAGNGNPSLPSKPIIAENPRYPPGPPAFPKVVDTTKNSVDVMWGKPAYDGDSPVIGYIVEMSFPESPDEFKLAAKTLSTKYTIGSLDDGRKYRFAVKAVNAIGESERSEVEGFVVPKDILEAPSLELDSSLLKTLIIKAGNTIRLSCAIKGRPVPSVSWAKVNGELPINRMDIKTSDLESSVIISNCNRDDSGKYQITLENSCGKKSATVSVRVQDSPGPPGPITFKEVSTEAISFSWDQPVNDGGSSITNYIVEKRESTKKSYATLTTQCIRTSWTANNLETGKSYFFRSVFLNFTKVNFCAYVNVSLIV